MQYQSGKTIIRKGNLSLLTCTKCEAPLQREVLNTRSLSHCRSCDVLLRAEVFHAMFRKQAVETRNHAVALNDEAGCFYHSEKKAVIPCSVCGRFLCALCHVDLNGLPLCPLCLETGKKKQKIKNLENHRILYDTIVLSLAVYPLLLVWPTLLTAPLAVFMAIRYWKTPTSIIPRSKLRLIAALVISGLQIFGWSVVLYLSVIR